MQRRAGSCLLYTSTVNSDESKVTCETFIPGFTGDLYGTDPVVEFHAYLSPSKKFDTLDELRECIDHAAQRLSLIHIFITEDEIASLKRFKDDAKEVAEGYECGVTLAKFADVKEGDVYAAFKLSLIHISPARAWSTSTARPTSTTSPT